MTSDPADILIALQFGDSAFPAGSFAFSWGLEGLAADGLVATAADVGDAIAEQLAQRWHTMDRPLLRAAFAARTTADLIALDHLAEAATWAEPMRAGSRRAGRAMLGVFARLGHAGVAAYRTAAAGDGRLGHLAVTQGLVFREAGLSLSVAESVSGWSLASSLASAAIRLGVVGHLDAQRILGEARVLLTDLLARDPVDVHAISSFTPLADVAVARSASRHLRMFAT